MQTQNAKHYKLVRINPQLADKHASLKVTHGKVEQNFNPLIICTLGGGFKKPEPAAAKSELFTQVWGLVACPGNST